MYYQVVDDAAQVVQPTQARRNDFSAHHLEVRMFHVGHGECILIVFPNGRAWLIDAGNGTGSSSNGNLAENIVDYLGSRGLFLQAFIPTHPHSDHARAFTAILSDPSPHLDNPLTIYRSNDPGWFDPGRAWIPPYRQAVGSWGDEFVLEDERWRERIGQGITAHLFAGSTGRRFYVSIFLQLRFHGARLLFTGDAYKSYERDLLDGFGADFFNSDVLKITHHGSEHGTDERVLAAIRAGIAIASTGQDGGHRLEDTTRDRIAARGTRVFETYRNQSLQPQERDIVVETDGLPVNGGGILYRVRRVAPAFG